MMERPLSSALSSVELLEYRDVGSRITAMVPASLEPTVVEPVKIVGVPEEEAAKRVQAARAEAMADAEERVRIERERARQEAEDQLVRRLREFDEERARYFRCVEREVVQLALSIARKIIGREAELDPTLLAGLVRIALDRMQSGPAVRLRVAPAEVEHWTRMGQEETGGAWDVIADESVEPGGCVVETELGSANFSFEAQLRDIEESFARLLAHRPAA